MPGISWNIQKKRFYAFFITIFLVGFLACNNAATAAEAKVIRLRYCSAYMASEPPNKQANHALDLVEEKTKGKVKISRFMGGTLGGALEQLDLVSSGAVDIIALHVDQFPQQLPLHQIMNTEQLVGREQGLANVTALTMEIEDTKAIFEEEQRKNNIKILYWHVQGPTGITAGFPANSLADLKGKKVSVISGFQRKVFNELGWIPVNVQIPELYESLSRGVIEAIFMATSAVVPLKWYEVGKTHLVLSDNVALSQPITLNLDKWNELPGDVKQAFIEASRETAKWSIREDLRIVEDTYDAFKKAEVKMVPVSREENDVFFEVLLRYAMEEYLDNTKARGVEDKAAVILKYWNKMKWGKREE